MQTESKETKMVVNGDSIHSNERVVGSFIIHHSYLSHTKQSFRDTRYLENLGQRMCKCHLTGPNVL